MPLKFGLLLAALPCASSAKISSKELPMGKLFDADDGGFFSSVIFDPSPLGVGENENGVSLMSVSEIHHTVSHGNSIVVPLPETFKSRPWWQEWMFNLLHGLSMFLVLKMACMTSNLFFQSSPFFPVLKWRSEGSTGQADAAPLVSIFFGCCQWCFYGTFAWYVTGKSGFLVIVYANAIGVFLGAFYVLSFQNFCKSIPALTKLHLYYKVVSTLICLQIIVILLLPRQKALFFSGLVSSSCTIMGAVSPLTYLSMVFKSGSSAPLPRPLVYSLFVSSVLWFSCGVLLWDVCLFGPNFLSTCVASYLIFLCHYYPNVEPTALHPKVEKEGYEAKVEEGYEGKMEKLVPEDSFNYGSTGETMDAPGGTF
jgi:hypothetical protein